MNAHALGVLEFSSALDLVAGYASSPLGAERVRESEPASDSEWIEREHARVAAMRALTEGDAAWHPQQMFDIRPALTRLRVEGASLSPQDLLSLRGFLRSSRLSLDSFKGDRVPQVASAMIKAEIESLIVASKEEKALDHAVDDDGNIRDEASPVLRRVRREMRGAQGEIVRMLEKIVARLESRFQVPDMSVSVRNGRFVIPVRREARSVVGGIVHDTSSTGGTLFVEPPAERSADKRARSDAHARFTLRTRAICVQTQVRDNRVQCGGAGFQHHRWSSPAPDCPGDRGCAIRPVALSG